MNRAARWFCITVWIGVLLNIAFGMLGLLAPERLFALTGVGETVPTMWARDAGLFLIMVSLFYIPAAHDPHRYRVNAWLLVVGRFVYVIFWFWGISAWGFPQAVISFGIADLVVGIIQGILLIFTFRTNR